MEGLGQSLVSDLVHLGLKEYEARVLIALVKSGRSLPASKLVSVSQVPRNKIYQVLESLIGLELAKMDEITGSANLYSLLYEPEKLSLILKKQLTEPIENAATRVQDQLTLISNSLEEEGNEEELIHQVQIIKGRHHIFRLLKKNIEGAKTKIFTNMLPVFVLLIKDELEKAKQRGVNVSLVLTDEELVILSREVSLDLIAHSVTGASLSKLRDISKLPIFDQKVIDFSILIDPFEKFLKNRPNLIIIDSESEDGILFMILKSEDPSSTILGVQASNKELINSFTYLESIILALISSLQSIQQNLIDEKQ
ncbi:MAG: helix-turn-helix domain-containing protein [Candidatus Hodarchaeales archaeon]|jgi:sugar-specific transcriptional regulator TrmB